MKKLKELEDLTALERAMLLTCCDANHYALKRHVPIQALLRRINKSLKKDAKKTIKTLVSNGFLNAHPTKGGMTYGLTKKGLEAGNRLRG